MRGTGLACGVSAAVAAPPARARTNTAKPAVTRGVRRRQDEFQRVITTPCRWGGEIDARGQGGVVGRCSVTFIDDRCGKAFSIPPIARQGFAALWAALSAQTGHGMATLSSHLSTYLIAAN